MTKSFKISILILSIISILLLAPIIPANKFTGTYKPCSNKLACVSVPVYAKTYISIVDHIRDSEIRPKDSPFNKKR